VVVIVLLALLLVGTRITAYRPRPLLVPEEPVPLVPTRPGVALDDVLDEAEAELRDVRITEILVCDALLLDETSRSDTYPTIRIGEDDVDVGHEATVSKIGEEQLFYLQSHGIPEDEASKMIVNGFIEPITKELPMEYAVEMNRLIELQMEGSIG